MTKKAQIHARTLLVEGEDDKKFFTTVLTKDFNFKDDEFIIEPPKDVPHPEDEDKKLVYRNGINTLLKILPIRLGDVRNGKIEQLGIVIDADSGEEFGFQNRRKQVTDILEKHGYTITEPPSESNTGESFTHEKDGFIVWLWIMPNHASEGMFEDFLLETINEPTQTKLLEKAKDTIKNLGEKQLFIDKHILKAHLSTWLAWQKDVGMSVGYAYYKGLFKKDHQNIIAVKAWLENVFKKSAE